MEREKRKRDPSCATLVTEHVTLKSKLQLGGENNVVTKLIKMELFHQQFYLLRQTSFFVSAQNCASFCFSRRDTDRTCNELIFYSILTAELLRPCDWHCKEKKFFL